MCGIAGILSLAGELKEEDESRDQAILDLLRHRGPDDSRLFKKEGLTLFHTRLQIIDTSEASAQPFHYPEKNDALVFNGEIFNYSELGKNYRGLRTRGDVEVLYRLLQEKGADGLNELNGFFAFAYLEENGSLLLARDRFGEKPLYYYSDGRNFIFASELRALMELAGPQELNFNQVYTYCRLNYCSGPETIFKNVHRLLPGQVLRVTQGKITTTQWYTLEKTEAEGDLYTLLDDAVRLRLRADVPTGAFLSGGLDSSIISALASKHVDRLRTFCIGFKNEEFLDETSYAEKVAKHIGSEHQTFRLGEDDFLANLDPFLNSIDEPFADSSAFNLYMISMQAHKHIRVALTGDGADELFKGYNKHRAFMLSGRTGARLVAVTLSGLLAGSRSTRANALGNRKRQLEKFAVLSSLPHSERLKFLASVSGNSECASLLQDGVSSLYFDSLFSGSKMLKDFTSEDQFDIEHVLADDMLVKADRFSMRHGLELRSPFLDFRVVEYALNLPLSQKINNRRQKIAPRKAFGKLLPNEILSRGKRGFELPLERWLKDQLRDRIENDWLNKKDIESQGVFSSTETERLKAQLWNGSAPDAPARIWALIVFRQWMHNFDKYILTPQPETAEQGK